jgi:exosortase A-associated hydrolase 1
VPDIRAAVDALVKKQPAVTEVLLVGECESASGILFYAWQDSRVAGAVLVNPWVRTEEGQAQVIIKDYYWERLRQPAFWAKVRKGEFDLVGSFTSLLGVLRAFMRGRRMFANATLAQAQDDFASLPLPVKTATGLSRFKGRVLLLMSGHDYIAREFDEVTTASRAWDGLLSQPQLLRRDVAGADHTFSKKVWKNAASDAVVAWARSW